MRHVSVGLLCSVVVALLCTVPARQAQANAGGEPCCRTWDEFAAHCRAQGGTPSKNPARCEGSDKAPLVQAITLVGASPVRAVAASCLLGCFAGALGGSLAFDADSGSLAAPWALIGGGSVLAIGLLKNRQWSFPAKLILSSAAGAGIASGAGALADGKIKKGSVEDLDTPDKFGSYAVKGAEVGAAVAVLAKVVSFVMPTESFRAFPAFAVMRRQASRVSVLQRGSRLGLNLTW